MPVPLELKALKVPVNIWKSSGARDILDISDIVAVVDPSPREALQTLIALYPRGLAPRFAQNERISDTCDLISDCLPAD
jgi:hypothetical protein